VKRADLRQLTIIWQHLVSAGGCPRCDATYQHLQSAIVRLREALKPLNVEPVPEVREISENSFRKEPAQSNRIWIADKPIEEWIGAGVGSSKCCSVCGDEPCRTMELEGNVFEDIPEAVIIKAALIAASGFIGQTT
jgi:anti-sigma factor RsiW